MVLLRLSSAALKQRRSLSQAFGITPIIATILGKIHLRHVMCTKVNKQGVSTIHHLLQTERDVPTWRVAVG
jgi:hypothetical protein